MTSPPGARFGQGDAAYAHAEGAGRYGPDLVSLTEAHFRQIEALLAQHGFGEEASHAFNRLRVSSAEQAAALGELITEGARQQQDLDEVHALLRKLPMPVLRLDGDLGLLFANEAARQLLGGAFEKNGASTLRRALTRPQIGRLSAALAHACDLPGEEIAAPIRLVISAPPQPPRPVLASLLRASKTDPDSPSACWLILMPETGVIPADADLVRLLLDSFPDPLSVTDADGRVVLANSAYIATTGKTAEAVLGNRPSDFLPLIEALHQTQLDARVRTSQAAVTIEQLRPRPLDTQGAGATAVPDWERLRSEKLPLLDELGQVMGVVTRSHEVSAELRARELAGMVFDHSTEAIVLTDPDLRVLQVNAAFEQLSGFGQDRLFGRGLETLLCETRPDDGSGQTAREGLEAGLRREGDWRGEVALRSAEGRTITCWSRITRLADHAGTRLGHVAMFSDLTLLRQTQADNLRLANYDLLTGLPNRRQLSEWIDHWIGLAQRDRREFSLLFLDLDEFKTVNDSLGHETGDVLLGTVAARLREGLGAGHFAARIGGDEFVVVLGDTGAERAQEIAREIIARLAAPLDLPGLYQYRPAASVGIACFGQHGDSRDALLRNADLAMYAGKLRRRAVTVYDPAMGVEALRELDLRTALAGAVERGEMVLHFQPLFDLADRRPRGCEALIRWNRPGRGLLPPREFLPVAERAGLMAGLDRWVLTEAAKVLRHWRQAGLVPADWVLSINQTAADLAAPDWIEALAASCDVEGGCGGLQIELAEDQLATQGPGALEAIERLRELGVGLAIDDFGTGYSCLADLARLPVAMLKIDARFVRGLESDALARPIVEAITSLAQRFGHATLAEGIETEVQAATLAGLGCAMGQGFLLSEALPQAEFEARFLT